MNQHSSLPFVSVVIIGRNEAKNLPACIQSVRDMDYPPDRIEIIYVDTDSTDDSPKVARSFGINVYEEHSDFPSAGRARNRGWREAKHDIVHFVDGDMTVHQLYLRQAVLLLGQKNVMCVIGRLEERDSDKNMISRILQYPWQERNPGRVNAPGAGGTFMKEIFLEIGGYKPEMARGEESDLGYRIRQAGYNILMIDQSMGIHDYAIRTPFDLWGWYKTKGRSFARVLCMPKSKKDLTEMRGARRTLIQLLLSGFAGIALLSAGLWWILFLMPFLLFFYVIFRYWQPARLRSIRIQYFLLEYYLKPAIWHGMLEYAIKRR